MANGAATVRERVLRSMSPADPDVRVSIRYHFRIALWMIFHLRLRSWAASGSAMIS